MANDIDYFGWTVRDNQNLADGNLQKFTAIPPVNSRCHRKTFPTLDAAKESIDRRTGHRSKIQSEADTHLARMLASRRKVKALKQQLEVAMAEAAAAKKAFMEYDPA